MPNRAARRSAFVLMCATMLAMECPDDFVPVVTTITVAPNPRAFTALTQTQQFTATVRDQEGNAMTGQTVTWASTGPAVTVNATGLATAQAVGSATITASIGTVSGSAMATVTQVPATLTAFGGNNQSGQVGTQLALPVVARVNDAQGQPIPNVTVGFVVTTGGGSVGTPSGTTIANGQVSSTWTVGANAGPQTLTASSTGLTSAVFNATATAPPAQPNSIAVSSGNNQTGLATYQVNLPPAAIVRDVDNNPVQGATVTFAVTVGGGSVTSGSATTNAQGIAQVGWSINVGANTMTASVAGVATPATFNATGVTSTFNIEVRYALGSSPSAAMIAAFDSAKARWQRVIFGDEANVNNVGITAATCNNAGLPPSTENIDDVLIFAVLVPIDGQGGVLGSAGPCGVRTSDSTALVGFMRFDTADLGLMETQGILEDVILHEMGHVLGLGTLWGFKGKLIGAGTLDSHFNGVFANQKFDDIGGLDYTGGSTVPVENCAAGVPPSCGPGTRDGHWREFDFTNELMTGYINPGLNPLSVVSAAQFGDMGYQINLGESDAFVLDFSLRALRASDKGIYLGDDLLRIPLQLIDPSGRVVRTLQPK